MNPADIETQIERARCKREYDEALRLWRDLIDVSTCGCQFEAYKKWRDEIEAEKKEWERKVKDGERAYWRVPVPTWGKG